MTPTRRRLLFSAIAVLGALLLLELGARAVQLVAPRLFVVAPNQEGIGPGVSLEPDPELLRAAIEGALRSGRRGDMPLPLDGHERLCDVVGALQRAVAAHGQMSDAAAGGYVKELQAKGRLMQELWS